MNLKKLPQALLLAALLGTASLVSGLPAHAADLKMKVNDTEIAFADKPFLQDGRSLFPLRDLLIALGVANDDAHIVWNGDEQSVTAVKGDNRIKLAVGEKGFYRNGQLFTVLDVPAVNVDGHVFLPVRAVAEALGYYIDYNAETGTVEVANPVSGKADKPGTSAPNKEINVEELIHALFGQTVESLTPEQTESVNAVLAMDRPALAGKLAALYDLTFESSPVNLEIVHFIGGFWTPGIQGLTDYSISRADDKTSGYKVNKLLAALPGADGVKALGGLLLKHPSADVRYNAAYLLSKSHADIALQALIGSFASETDDKVLGNAMAAADQVAGTDASLIGKLFDKYVTLEAAKKATFQTYLSSVAYGSEDIKAAWQSFLNGKAGSADAVGLIKGAHLN